MATETISLRDYFILIVYSCIILVAMMGMTLAPTRHANEFLFFPPPWADEHSKFAIVQTSGAQIISASGFMGATVVTSNTSNLVERLYSAGALFVVRADALSGCFELLRLR